MTAKLPMNQMNGMVMDATAAYKLQQQSDAVIFVCFADIVKDVYIHVIYAADKIMKKHTEEVRAFFSRWLETVQYVTTHKADMGKFYTKKFLPGALH